MLRWPTRGNTKKESHQRIDEDIMNQPSKCFEAAIRHREAGIFLCGDTEEVAYDEILGCSGKCVTVRVIASEEVDNR